MFVLLSFFLISCVNQSEDIKSVELLSDNIKLEYFVGDDLDFSTIEVKVEFADGNIFIINNKNVTIDASNYDKTSPGTYKIFVTYANYKTFEIEIEVLEIVQTGIEAELEQCDFFNTCPKQKVADNLHFYKIFNNGNKVPQSLDGASIEFLTAEMLPDNEDASLKNVSYVLVTELATNHMATVELHKTPIEITDVQSRFEGTVKFYEGVEISQIKQHLIVEVFFNNNSVVSVDDYEVLNDNLTVDTRVLSLKYLNFLWEQNITIHKLAVQSIDWQLKEGCVIFDSCTIVSEKVAVVATLNSGALLELNIFSAELIKESDEYFLKIVYTFNGQHILEWKSITPAVAKATHIRATLDKDVEFYENTNTDSIESHLQVWEVYEDGKEIRVYDATIEDFVLAEGENLVTINACGKSTTIVIVALKNYVLRVVAHRLQDAIIFETDMDVSNKFAVCLDLKNGSVVALKADEFSVILASGVIKVTAHYDNGTYFCELTNEEITPVVVLSLVSHLVSDDIVFYSGLTIDCVRENIVVFACFNTGESRQVFDFSIECDGIETKVSSVQLTIGFSGVESQFTIYIVENKIEELDVGFDFLGDIFIGDNSINYIDHLTVFARYTNTNVVKINNFTVVEKVFETQQEIIQVQVGDVFGSVQICAKAVEYEIIAVQTNTIFEEDDDVTACVEVRVEGNNGSVFEDEVLCYSATLNNWEIEIEVEGFGSCKIVAEITSLKILEHYFSIKTGENVFENESDISHKLMLTCLLNNGKTIAPETFVASLMRCENNFDIAVSFDFKESAIDYVFENVAEYVTLLAVEEATFSLIENAVIYASDINVAHKIYLTLYINDGSVSSDYAFVGATLVPSSTSESGYNLCVKFLFSGVFHQVLFLDVEVQNIVVESVSHRLKSGQVILTIDEDVSQFIEVFALLNNGEEVEILNFEALLIADEGLFNLLINYEYDQSTTEVVLHNISVVVPTAENVFVVIENEEPVAADETDFMKYFSVWLMVAGRAQEDITTACSVIDVENLSNDFVVTIKWQAGNLQFEKSLQKQQLQIITDFSQIFVLTGLSKGKDGKRINYIELEVITPDDEKIFSEISFNINGTDYILENGFLFSGNQVLLSFRAFDVFTTDTIILSFTYNNTSYVLDISAQLG